MRIGLLLILNEIPASDEALESRVVVLAVDFKVPTLKELFSVEELLRFEELLSYDKLLTSMCL